MPVFLCILPNKFPNVNANFPSGRKLAKSQHSKEKQSSRYDDHRRHEQASLPRLVPKCQMPGSKKGCNVFNIPGIVNRQKAYFRLRGVSIDKVYSLNRSRTSYPEGKFNERSDDLDISSALDNYERRTHLHSMTDELKDEYITDDSETNTRRLLDTSHFESSIRLLEEEDKSQLPKIGKYSKSTRKLGKISVTPRCQKNDTSRSFLTKYVFSM